MRCLKDRVVPKGETMRAVKDRAGQRRSGALLRGRLAEFVETEL